MNEAFSILVDSRSRFETGEAGGFWLDMPATREQLHAAMESVGITADNPQDFFIHGYSDNEEKHFALPYDMVCAAEVDELNYLAARLNQLDPAEVGKLNAALQRQQGFENIGQIIDFTYNVDFFVHLPDVQTAQGLGDYYLNKSGMVQMPEEWKGGIDLAAFGRNAAEQENGSFTQYGYILESGDEWERHFEGRDVPEEYRIMSFPQPPTRPDPEKADLDAISTRQAATLTAEPPQPVPVNPIVLTSEKQADKLKEITDRLEQGISQLFESERYKEYLRVMSKFHNYSFNNTLLIAMQKPDASLVAGFSAWKNNFQRNVVKGEKGIKIIAPSPFKIKQEMEKIDPHTQKPVIGADGKPVMEEKEVTIPAYKVVSVFDVSQTEGKELPDIAVDELTGSVEQYGDFFAALEKTSPVPIGFEKIEGSAHGYYHLEEKRIAIDEGMSELQTLKTAIHEVAHAKLHDIDLNAPKEERQNRPDRRTREVEAESVAYTVCQHYGLDTSDYSFGYVAGWSSGKELSELKSSLETIRATAAEIINSIDGHIAELQKAREAQQEAQSDLAAEPTVTVIWSESDRLRDGQTMRLSEADKLFASFDEAHKDSPGYDKTKFRIDFVMNGEADYYEGRQDFGDGDGGLIEHIEKYHTYYADNPDWDNHLLRNEGKEALEADKAQREMLLHEFVPYLKLHCNLADMEQAAQRAMRAENLSPAEAAFYDAMQKHVAECRGMLNQGDYNLPPAPRLADFDPDLQAYKQHVMDEIAQEAASAGMTVEEYAANGYEPYAPTQDAPVFGKLPQEQQQALSDTVKDTLQMLVDMDLKNGGEVSAGTLEAIAAQGYSYRDGQLEKQEQTPAADAPQQTAQAAAHLTDLQKKAVEIAQRYENLPLQEKIGIIAQAFGCTSGEIVTSPCTGKWRGTSDMSIKFDNGASLFIGNHVTPKTKTAQVRNEFVNAALVQYNPEIISAAKETALAALMRREAVDNEIAAQKGLKPYTLLNVEFNDGADDKTGGYMGWYYVTLAVDGKICSHMETGLNHDIADGKVSDTPTRENYYTAGALKEADVDYVFNNVGFSSTSGLYSLHISDTVRERAEKTLSEREAAQAAIAAPQQGDTFTIYQLKAGDETRDFRFEPYDRLQAAGLAVDPANYEQTYTAPLAPDMTLDSIFEKFNIDRPADFTGHSLSVSDVVVLHQNGQDAAHYVDRFGFKEVPEFLQEQQQVLTPDDHLTGEQITTPRGSFYLTDMSREQMEAAGYGFHHNSDDGKYAIMGNGTRAFAISNEPQQRENPLKAAEQTTEQNYNMIDGQINNTPTVGEIEARAKAGEQISLSDLADAIKADKERGGKTPKSRSSKKPEQKPSIRAQLATAKEQAKQQPKKQPEKSKGKEMEV